MRVIDLLMFKGVRKVREDYEGYKVILYVSPWWMWSKKRKAQLEDTLDYLVSAGIWYELKTHWW